MIICENTLSTEMYIINMIFKILSVEVLYMT